MVAGIGKNVLCVHCKRCKQLPFKRGLCYGCYNTPEVRECYPTSGSKCGRKGDGHGKGFRDLPLPDAPTDARPGSEEKMAVMKNRLEAGFHLHHPQDATFAVKEMSFAEAMEALAALEEEEVEELSF